MPRGRKGNKTPTLRQKYMVEYEAWVNALHRCHNPRNLAYKKYGARGITVCDEWRDAKSGFANFLSDMGPRPSDELSLERTNNDAGYCKSNCAWADKKTQQNNLGSYTPVQSYAVDCGLDRYGSPLLKYGNRVQSLADWARELDMKPATIRQRLQRGLTVEQSLARVSYKVGVSHPPILQSLLIQPASPTIH